jgi:hypothetical protein
MILLNKIINTTIQPTNVQSIKLRSSLCGLTLFFGELVLEPLLFGSRRLTDLLELLLKVSNLLFPLCRVVQQVGPTFGPFC